MRRWFCLFAVATLCIGLIGPSAFAVTPTTQVSRKQGAPDPWTLGASQCTDPTVDASSGIQTPHPYGPSTPPLGQGSLKIALAANATGGLGTQFLPNTGLSDLSAFDTWVYVPSTGGAQPLIGVTASDNTYDYALIAPPPATTDTWLHIDFMTAPLTWTSTTTSTQQPGPSGVSTLHDFIAGHPGVIVFNAGVVDSGCGPHTFYVDALTLDVGTNATTTDFEPAYPTAFTLLAHPTSILIGKSAAVTARLDLTTQGTSSPMGGQTVLLYSRPAGSTAGFKPLWATNTDPSTGIATFPVTPTRSTQYQARFAADGTAAAPAATVPFTIIVRQRVVVTSKPVRVRLRRTALVRGRVTPNRAGVTVRLVRLVSGRRTTVGTVRTTTGGYFTIKALMRLRGTATYVVTALPYPGEGQGQSVAFKITTK